MSSRKRQRESEDLTNLDLINDRFTRNAKRPATRDDNPLREYRVEFIVSVLRDQFGFVRYALICWSDYPNWTIEPFYNLDEGAQTEAQACPRVMTDAQIKYSADRYGTGWFGEQPPTNGAVKYKRSQL